MILNWEQVINNLVGKPIGISFKNGQGASGVLCGLSESKILVIEYLYQDQFALKSYDTFLIRSIHGFPPCYNQ